MSSNESSADLLSRIADALERLAPAPPRSPISAPPTPSSGAPTRARLSRSRGSTASIFRCCAASIACATCWSRTPAIRARPARQQRAAVGRARHGQVLAGQGRPCRHQREPEAAERPLKLIEIHREDIESLPALMALLRDDPLSLPGLLRRSFVRRRRHVLQVAQSRARGRRRGAAGQRAVLRDLEPPPPAAARHDGERALDARSIRARRSRRKCRSPTASASGSAFTIAARTNYLAMVHGYAAHYGLVAPEEEIEARRARMGDDARLALRPHRLAVHPGPRRAPGSPSMRRAEIGRSEALGATARDRAIPRGLGPFSATSTRTLLAIIPM